MITKRSLLTGFAAAFWGGPFAAGVPEELSTPQYRAPEFSRPAIEVPNHVQKLDFRSLGKRSVPVTYEFDSRVSDNFVASYPEASFLAQNGRGFRLAPDSILVEVFDAVGDGVANDQPAIQKAISYVEALGGGTIRFGSDAYAVWNPIRMTDPKINNAYDGHSIVVRGQIKFVGLGRTKSRILFRSFDGGDLQSTWQIVDGKIWRGAGIFLVGREHPPLDRSTLPSVALEDIILDGGCDRGSFYGFPANPSTGDGWDLTHKGLWAENDRATGDWTINRSEVVRFRGEIFYQGGANHGALIARDVVMGHTNADILNPCGTNLDIERGYFLDGNSGWEGWGGAHGRLIDCTFEHCRAMGGLQGGRAKQSKTKGGFTEPTPFSPGELPWVDLDIKVIDCGPVFVGSWVRGRIDMTDSFLALSTSIYPRISDVILTITARCRSKSLPSVVSITAGEDRIRNITIKVRVDQQSDRFHYGQVVARQGRIENSSQVSVALEQ